MDLFINVSEYEGIPVSIMEAISAGIPVIATDVGGTSEIIDEKFGKLIPKDFKVEYLAEIITKFHFKSFEEKNEMRNSARLFWNEKFNAEKNYNEFAKYLLEL